MRRRPAASASASLCQPCSIHEAASPAPVCSAPAITIVGNVTVDVVDGKKALGGAVSYAAAVASALGVRACIVTARGPHDAAIDRDFSALFEASWAAVQEVEAVCCFVSTCTALQQPII